MSIESHGHEHELEPQYGLPERLPASEKLLWQGSPDFAAVALQVFHLRKVAIYFALMLAWRGATVLADGGRGKGEALRRAISHIPTPITVFLDADGSHDPEDIPLLVEPILEGRADHVSASRLRGGSSELHGGFDEFFRLAGSSFITACINWRFGCRLSDSQNGFRAIRTSVLSQLDLREDLTTIEQEMIIKTLRRGFRMAEIPSHEHRRTHGASHIRVWRCAPRYGVSLVRYLFF